MRSQQPIVIATGSDLVRRIAVGRNSLSLEGVNDCQRLLREAGLDFGLFFVTPSYFRQRLRFPLPSCRLLINVISDPDQSPKVLRVLEQILVKAPTETINHPAAVRGSTRDQVATRLAGIPGLVLPRTIRINRRDAAHLRRQLEATGFRLPGILRPVGSHGGKGVRLVSDVSSLSDSLEKQKQRESYLTEFADYRSDDGYYRKYRCFVFGDAVVFRHMIISDRWLVHARDKRRVMAGTDWMEREEADIHAAGASHFSPALTATLVAIRRQLDLDYCGVDFTVLDSGELLLFEVNATMNFFPFYYSDRSHYSWQCLPRAVAAIRALVESRLEPERVVEYATGGER